MQSGCNYVINYWMLTLSLIKRIFASFRLNKMDFYEHICSTEDILYFKYIFLNLIHINLLSTMKHLTFSNLLIAIWYII